MAERRRIARGAPGRRRWLDWLAGAALALVLHGIVLTRVPLPRIGLTHVPVPDDAPRAERIEVRLLPAPIPPAAPATSAAWRELPARYRMPARELSRRQAEAPALQAIEPGPAVAAPPAVAPLALGLPGDYRSDATPSTRSPAERANQRLRSGRGSEAETDLGRGIASGARADCLKPRDDGGMRLGGLLGLPGLVADAATGKCRL